MKTTKKKAPAQPELKTIIAAAPEIDTWNGRPIEKRIVFDEKGTFDSYNTACRWLEANGYSHGSMARNLPIALLKGKNLSIPKWGYLDKQDIAALDGVLVSDDFREGQAEIIIFKK